MPLSVALFGAVVAHLPSPVEAQSYRLDTCWPAEPMLDDVHFSIELYFFILFYDCFVNVLRLIRVYFDEQDQPQTVVREGKEEELPETAAARAAMETCR